MKPIHKKPIITAVLLAAMILFPPSGRSEDYFQKANELAAQKKYGEAFENYERALETDGKNITVYITYGWYLFLDKKHVKALDIAKRGSALDPKNRSIVASLALYSMANGDAESGNRYYDTLFGMKIEKAFYCSILKGDLDDNKDHFAPMVYATVREEFVRRARDLYPDFLEACSAYQELLAADAAANEAFQKGDHAAGAGALERSVKACERLYGTEHGETGTRHTYLGSAYKLMRMYDKAIAHFEKALTIVMKVSGEESPDAANGYNYLGLSYNSNGEYDKAIAHYEKAAAIFIKIAGETHPDVANVYHNLGLAYKAKEAYDRAIGYYEKALAIFIKVSGEEHPDVASEYNNLGSAYYAKNEYTRSIGYHEKAVAIGEKILGGEHPEMATWYHNLGMAYYSNGQYDRAILFFDKALALYSKIAGEEHPDTAGEYNNLGNAYYFKGEYDRAVGYQEKALAIGRKTLGDEHPAIAGYYSSLGLAYMAKGAYDRAIGYFETALAIARKSLGDEHQDVAVYNSNLGQAYHHKGDYDKALAYHERALAIGSKTLGNEDPTIANFQNNLGLTCYSKGAFDEAVGYYEKALAIDVKVFGEGHPAVATMYNNLGDAYDAKGEYDRAIAYHEKALTIRLATLGETHPDVALSYGNLGLVFKAKGEYDRSIGFLEKALVIERTVYGDDHDRVASRYNNLGNVYEKKGEYDKAVGYLEKALATGRKTMGEEHPVMASWYNNLGVAYYSKGEHARAILYYEKALAIGRKTLGEDHHEIANFYNNLGAAYEAGSEHDKAIGYYEKALAVYKAVFGEKHRLTGTGYNNLGDAYRAKGEYDSAIRYHEQALAIDLGALGENHPNVATDYNNLGSAYEGKGDYDRAAGYYDKTLAIFRSTGERQSTITSANNLGILHLNRNLPEKARAAFCEAIAVIESARCQTGAGKIAFMARNIVSYYFSLKTSALRKDYPALFATAESMRSRGFLDRLSLAAALSVEGISPADRERMLALSDRIETLALQRSAEIDKSAAGQGREKLLALTGQLEQAEKEFAALDAGFMKNERYRNLRRPPIATLPEAQRLAGDGAILEYVIWEVNDKKTNENRHKQSYCIVITGQGMKLVELDRDFDYTGTVQKYRDTLTGGAQTRGVSFDEPEGDTPAAGGDRDKLAATLYEKLIAPVERVLAGITNVIIVPDGALAFLPFDALRKNAGSPYLCETRALTMSPSVSVLQITQGRSFGKDRQAMLAFGGAVYEKGTGISRGRGAGHAMRELSARTQEYYATRGAKEGAAGYFAGLGDIWFNLPGTGEEVAALAARVYSGLNAVIVRGLDVSEKGIKEQSRANKLASFKTVHFACHGYYDPTYPAYSSVVLSEVSGELKRQSTEDGYLSVEEVALLKFNADIVNLSACETGLGAITKGDGVLGLTRAFQVAGANRVGVTLWQVDDEATKEFMVAVYSKVVKQGMGFRAAYVETKREFVKSRKFSDPYFWSTFVLYGE